MEKSPDRVMDHMVDIETTAEDILADRQQMIDFDKKRQETRVALRTIGKDKKSKNQWVCFGNMFLKLPTPQTKALLQKDFDNIDGAINDTRKNLKTKVNKLRDFEQKDELKGFHLSPLTDKELDMIEEVL